MSKRTSPMEVSVLHNVEISPGARDTVYLVNHVGTGYQDMSEVKGNLALFNAAPELLEACLELIRGDGTDSSLQRTIDLARAAIAKAEGNEEK